MINDAMIDEATIKDVLINDATIYEITIANEAMVNDAIVYKANNDTLVIQIKFANPSSDIPIIDIYCLPDITDRITKLAHL